MADRLVIVGGGALGTMHAVQARSRGLDVVHLAREAGWFSAWTGSLTIGDTQGYAEPFDFDVDEAPYDHLRVKAELLPGTALPPARRRWARVQPGNRSGTVSPRSGSAGCHAGNRTRRPRHDLLARHSRGDVHSVLAAPGPAVPGPAVELTAGEANA